MTQFFPEGKLINKPSNIFALSNINTLIDAMKNGDILESRAILCDSEHNLHVDLNGIKGIIPREEGAIGIKEGTTRDIALISRVNRPVCFTVKEIIPLETGAKIILSRKDAQQKCIDEFLSKLSVGDIIDAKITHLEAFGAFADIGCGIIALIPIDAVSVSRIDHPKERFSVGMNIKVIIKSFEGGKITLSHKELLGTWEENVSFFTPGETVAGVIRSVESYGIFVELAPNLAGLAEPKADVYCGQQASVYIKSIIPSRMKIKLIIIDAFDCTYKPKTPTYFYKENHISKFIYSPENCHKQIITEFV